jgi:uncharacterized protein (DUF302 family)
MFEVNKRELLVAAVSGVLVSMTGVGEAIAETATGPANVTSRPITLDHIRITCRRSFEQVRAALQTDLPKFDPGMLDALGAGDEAKVKEYEKGSALFNFLERDHGDLLAIAGRKRKAIQYEIGNAHTATKMTRFDLRVALYVPLRVALFETEGGEAVFEYDRPSSLVGQFGDPRVKEVGLYLDRELESVLLKAAG